jgi:hypothetical protein
MGQYNPSGTKDDSPVRTVPVERLVGAFAQGVQLGQAVSRNRWQEEVITDCLSLVGTVQQRRTTRGSGYAGAQPLGTSPEIAGTPPPGGSPALNVCPNRERPAAVPPFPSDLLPSLNNKYFPEHPLVPRGECWFCKENPVTHPGRECPVKITRDAHRVIAEKAQLARERAAYEEVARQRRTAFEGTGEIPPGPHRREGGSGVGGTGSESHYYVVPGPGFGNHPKGIPNIAEAGIYVGQRCMRLSFLNGHAWGDLPYGTIFKHRSFENALQHWQDVHLRSRQTTVHY